MGEVTIHIRSIERQVGDGKYGIEIQIAHDDLDAHDWTKRPDVSAPKEIQLAYVGLEAMRRATPDERPHCPKCLSTKVYATPNMFECLDCKFKSEAKESQDDTTE